MRIAVVLLVLSAPAFGEDKRLSLNLRYRAETAKRSGLFHALTRNETWKPSETAVIVCDMWDLHHCLNAVRRVNQMAPRMNKLLKTARAMGVTIIHAPSSCMKFYKGHPARKNVAGIPRAKSIPKDIGRWCHKIPSEEKGVYPIDQSDGGEDDDPKEHAEWAAKLKSQGKNPRAPWSRQIATLEIENGDFITDNGIENWSILEHRKIKNVILVGVHTNMCVLGRPFGLRQLAKNGKNVVLCRDLTDTMYNPKRAPFVSHFTGTDLIVEHIEKWVCPTITSDQILGGQPMRFRKDTRPRLAIVMGEREYKTNVSLPAFARKNLGHHFAVEYVHAPAKERNNLPGLVEALRDADIVLLSVRRRALPPKQMKAIRDFIKAGKPVVGIRTANHAFSLRGKPTPKGREVWNSFDADVIGGNYTNHYGNGPKTTIKQSPADHPILNGVDVNKLTAKGSLYKVRPLKPTAKALLTGSIPDKPAEPLMWINRRSDGGATVYTSLGHIEDFKNKQFVRLLKNSLIWASRQKPPRR